MVSAPKPVSDLFVAFGATIKSRREELGLSQELLAFKAGLHRTYISELERGARNPSLSTLEKIANGLQITLTQLLKAAEKTKPKL